MFLKSKQHTFFIPMHKEYYIRYSCKTILFKFIKNENQPLFSSYDSNTDFLLAGVMVTFKTALSPDIDNVYQ
jgi:hypothetical protein